MYIYEVEELARAIAREREEEARQTRPHTERRPSARDPLRSRLAKKLMRAAVHLDPRAVESAHKTATKGCC